mmetsp:Transcript_19270/g.30183  ORF Transcript_19270/g.30183 Transcript_19270/m.30183 type:complete len:97 (-) Transcript_19270:372-662(-)
MVFKEGLSAHNRWAISWICFGSGKRVPYSSTTLLTSLLMADCWREKSEKKRRKRCSIDLSLPEEYSDNSLSRLWPKLQQFVASNLLCWSPSHQALR